MLSSSVQMMRGCLVWMYISFKLGICADNLAYHKPAWQSSLHHRDGVDSLDAPNAVDGRVTNNWFDGVCMHTHTQDTSPWIIVDLLGEFYVNSIKLYNRQDCCQNRLHDFIIEVFKTNPTRCASAQSSICINYVGVLSDKVRTVYCDTPSLGRYVRIWKPSVNAPGDVLSLCEIEIFGEQTAFAHTFIGMVKGKHLNSNSMTSVAARSRTSCVVECRVSGACVGVNYNTKNGVCELLTRPEPSDTVSDQDDWVYCGQDLC